MQAEARIYREWLNDECGWMNLSAPAVKLHVYLLASHRPESGLGRAMPDRKLCRVLSCAAGSARKAVMELEQAGWISLERGGGLYGARAARERVLSLTAKSLPKYEIARSETRWAAIPESWVIVPAWKTLKGKAPHFLVYRFIRHHAGAENDFDLGVKAIKRVTGLKSDGAAEKVREQLIERGFVTVEQSRPAMRGSLTRFPSMSRTSERWRYETWHPSNLERVKN